MRYTSSGPGRPGATELEGPRPPILPACLNLLVLPCRGRWLPHHPCFLREGKLGAISAVHSLSHRFVGCSWSRLNLDSATQYSHSPWELLTRRDDTDKDARATTSRTRVPSTCLHVKFRAVFQGNHTCVTRYDTAKTDPTGCILPIANDAYKETVRCILQLVCFPYHPRASGQSSPHSAQTPPTRNIIAAVAGVLADARNATPQTSTTLCGTRRASRR